MSLAWAGLGRFARGTYLSTHFRHGQGNLTCELPRKEWHSSHLCHVLLNLVGGFNPSEKYESQLGWLFPIYGKIKNVPNHQPEMVVKGWPTRVLHKSKRAPGECSKLVFLQVCSKRIFHKCVAKACSTRVLERHDLPAERCNCNSLLYKSVVKRFLQSSSKVLWRNVLQECIGNHLVQACSCSPQRCSLEAL